MPCETRLKPKQTISERAAEVRKSVEALMLGLSTGKVTVKVGREGGIVFVGDWNRDGVTDACAYRRIMGPQGSTLARLKIAAAEHRAGRQVDRKALAAGVHSHDGGLSWYDGH